MLLKFFLSLIIFYSFGFFCVFGQKSYDFQFSTDSMIFDGQDLVVKEVSGSIKVGNPSYFELLNQDSLSIRLRVKLIQKNKKTKKLKIRIDIKENNKWFKPSFFVDLHNFNRFHIRREQCWMKNKYKGIEEFPLIMNCNCSKPFKAINKHQFKFVAQVKVS